jgi:protein O-mannosyl-transferase
LVARTTSRKKRAEPRPGAGADPRVAKPAASIAREAGSLAREKRAPAWRGYSTLIAAVLLAAAGCLAYAGSFRGVLVFDDVAAITSNTRIKALWPLTTAASAPRDTTVAGRPVAALTLALNFALAPADARDALTTPGPGAAPEDVERFLRNIRGYHALNLVVHLLAGLALFGVVRRSLLAPALRERFGPPSTLLAFLIALIWLVHPLNTESVAYIVQRVESLMGMFYLLTLYCAIRAADPGPRRRWWIGAAIAACALGMGSKEAMVTAPIIVVLWDLLIGTDRRSRRPSAPQGASAPGEVPAPKKAAAAAQAVLRARWPLYAGLAATWLILTLLVAGNPRPGSVGFGIGGWTPWAYLQTQAGVVAHYVRLAIVPVQLAFDYDWPRAASFGEIAPQAVFLAALLILACIAALRRHPAGFAAAWFFLILAPTSSILPIPTEVAAEHRMYLPLAAIVALGVTGIHALARRLGGSRAPARERMKTEPGHRAENLAVLVVGLVIATTFGAMTYSRTLDYRSDEGLMRDTVAKRPGNIRARVAYGAHLLAAGRFAEAEAELSVAAGLHGSDAAHAQANMHLGAALSAQGKLAEGIGHLRQALAIDPALAEAHALLGEAYGGMGQSDLAGAHFRMAADGLPDNPAVLRRVAWQLATASDARFRDGRKAGELADRAVRLTGRRDVLALEALMAAYAEQERFGEAVSAGREALALANRQGNELFIRALPQEIALCEAGRKLR